MRLVATNWIGEGRVGATTNGRGGLQLYKALQILRTKGRSRKARQVELIVAVGDFVHLRGPDKHQPYIARVMDLWEDPRTSQKMLTAQWCYRPSDLTQYCTADYTFRENEVILTELLDDNEVGTILDLARVCFSNPSNPKPIPSMLFVDHADHNSWKDGSSSSQKYSNYLCSKKYVPRANGLVRLTETDVEMATAFICGMSTKYVNQLLHQLAHLKAAQMDVQQEDDAGGEGLSRKSVNKPETDENDESMNAGYCNPPLALTPSLVSRLSKKRSFQGDSEEDDIKMEKKKLELTAEAFRATTPEFSSNREDLVNEFKNKPDAPFIGKAGFSQDETKCRLASCIIQ